MSTKKDKLLESAQKFILKGQLDRAIRDFQELLALDPDIRHRQRLAELLSRANRREEAIREYEAIGRHYVEGSLYLKAVSVYRQIQKLAPDNLQLTITIADLNAKQGLTGNALTEYSSVFTHFEKAGQTAEAVDILDRMLVIDPDNAPFLSRKAENLVKLGRSEEAYRGFCQLALLHQKRGDEAGFARACARIEQLFPERRDFLLEIFAGRIARGDVADALPRLQDLARRDPPDYRVWSLLADAYQAAGNDESIRTTCRRMVELFPEESRPREWLIQLALDDGDDEQALALIEAFAPHFLARGAYAPLERGYQALLSRTTTDQRILQGLKTLYGASGDQEKRARVERALAEQGAGSTGEVSAEEYSMMLEPSEPTVAASVPVAPVVPVTIASASVPFDPELCWEEEIDLGLPEGAEVVGGSAAWLERDSGSQDLAAAEIVPEYLPDQETTPVSDASPAETTVEMELAVDFGSFGDLLEVAAGPELLGSDPDGSPVEDESPGPEVAAADETAEDQPLCCGEPAEEFALVDESLPDQVDLVPARELSADLCPDEEVVGGEEEPEPPFDREETESQFNLGIAYKEMGLLDKALAEFAAAAANPERRVACLILQAVCYRDKGDLTRAVNLLEECIAAGKAQDDELLDLTFELALTHEGSGQEEIALDLYRSIRNRTPDYRDVGRRIACLQGAEEDDPADFALEDLEILEE